MKKLFLFYFLIIAFLVSSCSEFRQVTGREKIKIDEFAILEQKSIEIPETFELDFSKINSNNQINSKEKFIEIFKVNYRSTMDENDLLFATNFNFEEIEPGIRDSIFEETKKLKNDNRNGFDMLTDNKPGPLLSEILNSEDEIKRLIELGLIQPN